MKRFFFLFLLLISISSAAHAVEIKSVTSPGGITAWLIEDHTLPIISMGFSFDGGSKLDPMGKEGAGDFTSALLDEGAGPYNSTEFHDRVKELAASISFGVDNDYFSGSLRTLTQNKDEVFDLTSVALEKPRFDAPSVARIRSQFMAILKQKESDPDTQASELWWKTYFAGHPYGRIYDAKSINEVQKKDLTNYLRQTLNRRTLKIGVAGDITPEELGAALDRMFKFLPDFDPAIKPVPFAAPQSGNIVFKTMDQPQTVAVFGQKGLKRDNPDFYPLYVLNHILGGGSFSSRLTKTVREDKGLAYSVYSSIDTMRDAGIILGGVATKRQDFEQSLQLIRQVWAELPDNLTAEDLETAKKYLIGSFPLRFSSTPQIAGILLALQQDNLGIDFFTKRNDLVEAVTLDDVRRVAKQILSPDYLLFAVIGDYHPGKRE
ncbi:MAG: insulinase family protein [Alphaproteobacteria bacterium]|nr:MAG: insulinase family protein [Alphaproteobacteria bacterium]